MQQPLCFYEETTEYMQFYLIDCQSGLMNLLIFQDKTVMLFDCNVTDSNEEDILNFLKYKIPKKYKVETDEFVQEIDIFVNSHRDLDHLRGLKKINEKFKIKSIWDSGQSGANIDNADYNYYMYLRRKLREENEKNLFVPVPSNIKIKTIGNADIYCLAAEEDFQENYINEVRAAAKIQHTNSMVLLVTYAGQKILLTGDSDWKSWKEGIVPNFKDKLVNYENADILVASHHGSRSFFTDEANEHIDEEENPETTYIESIQLINPVVTLISCGDYEEYHHPNKEAMALYKKWTSNEQVYTTKNLGTICGIINNNGNFTVVPNRFYTNINGNHQGFEIKCSRVENGESKIVNSGDEIKVGCSLKFSIFSWGDIINDNTLIYWEVSNGGTGDDFEHQEIYHKGNEEKTEKYKFERELSYKGTHLLRCRIINHKKNFDETKIFVVKGI